MHTCMAIRDERLSNNYTGFAAAVYSNSGDTPTVSVEGKTRVGGCVPTYLHRYRVFGKLIWYLKKIETFFPKLASDWSLHASYDFM